MNSREAKKYFKSVFGGKKVMNLRRTKKLWEDNRIIKMVQTSRGHAYIAVSLDKNGQVYDIEAGLSDNPELVNYEKVRNYAYDHYKGRDLSIVDFNFIASVCYE